jgi:hypothetical protein
LNHKSWTTYKPKHNTITSHTNVTIVWIICSTPRQMSKHMHDLLMPVCVYATITIIIISFFCTSTIPVFMTLIYYFNINWTATINMLHKAAKIKELTICVACSILYEIHQNIGNTVRTVYLQRIQFKMELHENSATHTQKNTMTHASNRCVFMLLLKWIWKVWVSVEKWFWYRAQIFQFDMLQIVPITMYYLCYCVQNSVIIAFISELMW